MLKNLAIAAFAVATTTILAPIDGRAQELQYMQNGGLCKSALPVFEGNIRTWPLAISNEGTTNAFVTCSMLDRLGNASTTAGAWVHNRTAAAINISCTFITGNAVDGPSYYPKTGTFDAGTGQFVIWYTSDNGGRNFGKQANFSCNLPPGTELRFVAYIGTTNL